MLFFFLKEDPARPPTIHLPAFYLPATFQRMSRATDATVTPCDIMVRMCEDHVKPDSIPIPSRILRLQTVPAMACTTYTPTCQAQFDLELFPRCLEIPGTDHIFSRVCKSVRSSHVPWSKDSFTWGWSGWHEAQNRDFRQVKLSI